MYVYLKLKNIKQYPNGHMRKKDVVLTSMRRDDVASTLIRCHFATICPLGYNNNLTLVIYELFLVFMKYQHSAPVVLGYTCTSFEANRHFFIQDSSIIFMSMLMHNTGVLTGEMYIIIPMLAPEI